MSRFAAGEVDVLIATTVIEVGVDVPNAPTMVIMDADRFGISQLHQLRGRVGRGGCRGCACWSPTCGPVAKSCERLDAVASTTDGFELSRIDLETRREGDVLGVAQSGRRSSLKLLSVLRDEEVIFTARHVANSIVSVDAELAEYPALRGVRGGAALESETSRVPGEDLMRIVGGCRGWAADRRYRRGVGHGRPRIGSGRRCSRRWSREFGSFHGLAVLDLYAGSGAIGLEALSRGAARVVLVESDRKAARGDLGERQGRWGCRARRCSRRPVEKVASGGQSGGLRPGLRRPAVQAGDRRAAGRADRWPGTGGSPTTRWWWSSAGKREPWEWPEGFAALRDRKYGEARFGTVTAMAKARATGSPNE